jgi:hypothetical protein
VDPAYGVAYTLEEFVHFYGGLREWFAALAIPNPKLTAASQRTTDAIARAKVT